MKLFALFGVLALAAGASPAAASPTFRSDGPNAEAYGAAEGYPVGRATAGRMPLRFMVGSFSHYYHLLRTREVPRGGPVSELRRADPDLALTYLYDGAPRTLASIPAALAFDRVSQVYGSLLALDDVSLSIAAGELVCLLGQSGCGKTTLLRVAAGIEGPTQGPIRLDRREVTGPKLFLPPEAGGIGLMFQDYALFPHLSIIENVTFGLRGLAARDAEIAAKRALSRVGLERYAADYPHVLSGGEQQRVALARSIAPRPGVLLVDAPLSTLDRRLRDAIRDETVAILRETGATTVVVTHDPEEALRIADRIVLMQAGRIMQAGTAEEIYRRPAD